MPLEPVTPEWSHFAAISLALLWAGLVLGVSFLATPVKFTAPSLSRRSALDVGRVTFHLLIKVEWIALALLAGATVLAQLPFSYFPPVIALAAVLAIQTFLVLPPLDARTAWVIAGGTPPPSRLHLVYVVLEASKVLILAVTAVALLRALPISV